MFGFSFHVTRKAEPEPVYRYDAVIKFKDGREGTIEDAEWIKHYGAMNWVTAIDGGEVKHIHTDDALEVTITRRIKEDK